MAAHRLYATPAMQLREIATAAKREGLDFEAVWAMAVLTQPAVTQRMPVERRPPGAVVYPGDTADRAAWRLALEATKPAWSRAYRDEPSRGEEALRVLADALLDEIEIPAYTSVAA